MRSEKEIKEKSEELVQDFLTSNSNRSLVILYRELNVLKWVSGKDWIIDRKNNNGARLSR